ncbi:MAG: hypothetical protein HS117_18540 [Verrucomicrobiaceae bacterium]|nr:hypothetical protein [Verrucomicrobiaceae bacterium]
MIESTYPESFFNRCIEALEPTEALLECMLWRGFWGELRDDQLWLLHWSVDDLQFLRECGVSAHPVDGGSPARIGTAEDMTVCRNVFLSGAACGMEGVPSLGNSFEAFKTGELAEPIPVRHLDPGVALLVKALGLAGVYTVMSCDGHLKSAPAINLRTEWDWIWCEYVLKQVGLMLEIDNPKRLWFFDKARNKYPGWAEHVVVWNQPSDEKVWFECFSQIQRLARKLIESAQDFRRAKTAICTPCDLSLALREQENALKEMRRELDKRELLAAVKVVDEQALKDFERDRLRREALDSL